MRTWRRELSRLATAARRRADPAFLGLAAIEVTVTLVLLGVVLEKHAFDIADPVVLLSFGYRVAFELALYLAAVLLLLKLSPSRVPAAVFSTLCFFVTLVDAGVYLYGNTHLRHGLLALVTAYSVGGFLGPAVYALSAVFLATSAGTIILLPAVRSRLSWRSVAVWGLLLAVVAAAGELNRYPERWRDAARMTRHAFRFRNEELRYATASPLLNAWSGLVGAHDQPAFTVTGDVGAYADVIEKYDLPLGERAYQPLGLAPFKRVILFTLESLSLELIGAHNPSLPVEPAPFFLGTPAVASRTFTDIRCSALPTLEGLTVTFTSHPNYLRKRDDRLYTRQGEGKRPLYYYLSFPRLLRQHGYHTIFLRSASKFYAQENVVLQDLGFDDIIGREEFYARPQTRRYVYGWGVEDRFLYRELVDLLDQHRGEKLFVSVLGADTHPPRGRERYRGLTYPPVPTGFRESYAEAQASFLEAVSHLDYDLGQTVAQLAARGLLDEETLVVITADHACPYNSVVEKIPGYTRTSLGRIPLVFLTPRALPAADFAARGSQLDLAPTLFHLLGLPIPPGWWGDSLFSPRRSNVYVGYDAGLLRVESDAGREVIDAWHPRPEDRALLRLFDTIITKP